jgi:hypothetical protein
LRIEVRWTCRPGNWSYMLTIYTNQDNFLMVIDAVHDCNVVEYHHVEKCLEVCME